MTREEFKALRLKLGCETRRELAEQMGISKAPSSIGSMGAALPGLGQKLLRCLAMAQLVEKRLGVKI